MLTIEGIDFELPQMGKEPKMGYSDEYVEKTAISGKIIRIYRGKRYYATFSYAFLTEEERAQLNDLLTAQRKKGYLNVSISQPYGKDGKFEGGAILELNNDQTRFKWDSTAKDFVWTNWSITLKAVAYDNR